MFFVLHLTRGGHPGEKVKLVSSPSCDPGAASLTPFLALGESCR